MPAHVGSVLAIVASDAHGFGTAVFVELPVVAAILLDGSEARRRKRTGEDSSRWGFVESGLVTRVVVGAGPKDVLSAGRTDDDEVVALEVELRGFVAILSARSRLELA